MQDLIPKDRRLGMLIKSVYSLWREWLYSFGAITLCVILSYPLPKFIHPAVVLVVAWALSRYAASWRSSGMFRCVRVTSLTATVLTLSAVVMIISLVINKTDLFSSFISPETKNPAIPYITALIVFPITVVVMTVGVFTHGKTRHCHECKMSAGCSPEDNFAGNIFHREALFQLRMLFWISATLTVVNWMYYFMYYSNASINGRDKYFFVILPVVAYVASLFYTGSRYKTIVDKLRDIYSIRGRAEAVSVLRFLILRDDEMLLEVAEPKSDFDYSQVDTPAIVELPYTSEISIKKAMTEFEKISGAPAEDFDLRHLYNNMSMDGRSNIYHYVVMMKDEKPLPADWKLQGNWSTLDQINRLWKYNAITRSLAAEIHRIFTVTMAWKTYDSEGFRRYPIKNYHPTFRLRDFKDWDVDYSDPTWISVAANNQDNRMFRVRRLLAKIQGK